MIGGPACSFPILVELSGWRIWMQMNEKGKQQQIDWFNRRMLYKVKSNFQWWVTYHCQIAESTGAGVTPGSLSQLWTRPAEQMVCSKLGGRVVARHWALGMAGRLPWADASFCSVWLTILGSILFKRSGFAFMTLEKQQISIPFCKYFSTERLSFAKLVHR